jgi:hypothetical protein
VLATLVHSGWAIQNSLRASLRWIQKSGVKWMSSGTTRRCDRALPPPAAGGGPPPPGGVAAAFSASPRFFSAARSNTDGVRAGAGDPVDGDPFPFSFSNTDGVRTDGAPFPLPLDLDGDIKRGPLGSNTDPLPFPFPFPPLARAGAGGGRSFDKPAGRVHETSFVCRWT